MLPLQPQKQTNKQKAVDSSEILCLLYTSALTLEIGTEDHQPCPSEWQLEPEISFLPQDPPPPPELGGCIFMLLIWECFSTQRKNFVRKGRSQSPLVAQWVKDPVLSLQWLWLLLWRRFDPWPGNCHKKREIFVS